MALGTKEDGRTDTTLYNQAIIQSKLLVREFESLDNYYFYNADTLLNIF